MSLKNFKVRIDRPSWYNTELCNLERERDISYRKYRNDRVKKPEKYHEMVRVRKKFNKILSEAKQNFYKNQIEFYKNDSKNFWKMLNKILGSGNERVIERVYYHGTNILCNESDTADIINEFFAGIGGHDNTNNMDFCEITPNQGLVGEMSLSPLTVINFSRLLAI